MIIITPSTWGWTPKTRASRSGNDLGLIRTMDVVVVRCPSVLRTSNAVRFRAWTGVQNIQVNYHRGKQFSLQIASHAISTHLNLVSHRSSAYFTIPDIPATCYRSQVLSVYVQPFRRPRLLLLLCNFILRNNVIIKSCNDETMNRRRRWVSS